MLASPPPAFSRSALLSEIEKIRDPNGSQFFYMDESKMPNGSKIWDPNEYQIFYIDNKISVIVARDSFGLRQT